MLGRPRSQMRLLGALALCALAGCGSSSKSQTSNTQSAAQTTASNVASSTAKSTPAPAKPPRISIPVEIPFKSQRLPASFTCDGKNISLPIKWREIPANTKEIDLFIFNSKLAKDKLFADWAVAGLKPTVRQLQPGRLPAGAVVGRNSFGQIGYSVCPPKGTTGQYVVLLSALPRKIPASTGFDPNAIAEKAAVTAEFEGRGGFAYKRP